MADLWVSIRNVRDNVRSIRTYIRSIRVPFHQRLVFISEGINNPVPLQPALSCLVSS
ncbi:hypothetical protein PAHAL_7G089700 [Panicum hallii]|uniref:Uncharacterized protein n=1 Tax=Panicum hallii TaxID=206008 RepID=A0A2T8IBI1_9POAL|nr:hypothetical protein PAHAL_7G089700 [Panicum hallii]